MQSFKEQQGAIRKAPSMINAKKQRETINGKEQRSCQENQRCQENISCKDEHNKCPKEDRKGEKKQKIEQTNRK